MGSSDWAQQRPLAPDSPGLGRNQDATRTLVTESGNHQSHGPVRQDSGAGPKRHSWPRRSHYSVGKERPQRNAHPRPSPARPAAPRCPLRHQGTRQDLTFLWEETLLFVIKHVKHTQEWDGPPHTCPWTSATATLPQDLFSQVSGAQPPLDLKTADGCKAGEGTRIGPGCLSG